MSKNTPRSQMRGVTPAMIVAQCEKPAISKAKNGTNKTRIQETRKEARKRREQERQAQTTFIDQDLQEFIDEIEGRETTIDHEPSARDVLYGKAEPDFDEVSDEYQRKEMQGKFRILSHFINCYAKAVEGKQVCPVFFDESGEM